MAVRKAVCPLAIVTVAGVIAILLSVTGGGGGGVELPPPPPPHPATAIAAIKLKVVPILETLVSMLRNSMAYLSL